MDTIHIKKLTALQHKKIMSGGSVRIQAGNIPILLPTNKINKIRKTFAKQKGSTISLSQQDIEHNINGGSLSGLFTDFGHSLYDSSKPYLKEVVQGGIASLGAAAAIFQPELTPFIVPATIGLTTLAGQIIDNPSILRKGQAEQPSLQNFSPQYLPQYQPQYNNPYQGHLSSDGLYHSQMGSVADQWGYGLYAGNPESGEGLYAGGGLYAGIGKGIHPALISTNPHFLKNRHLPTYTSNYY